VPPPARTAAPHHPHRRTTAPPAATQRRRPRAAVDLNFNDPAKVAKLQAVVLALLAPGAPDPAGLAKQTRKIGTSVRSELIEDLTCATLAALHPPRAAPTRPPRSHRTDRRARRVITYWHLLDNEVPSSAQSKLESQATRPAAAHPPAGRPPTRPTPARLAPQKEAIAKLLVKNAPLGDGDSDDDDDDLDDEQDGPNFFSKTNAMIFRKTPSNAASFPSEGCAPTPPRPPPSPRARQCSRRPPAAREPPARARAGFVRRGRPRAKSSARPRATSSCSPPC
jgi:hypothetical protein